MKKCLSSEWYLAWTRRTWLTFGVPWVAIVCLLGITAQYALLKVFSSKKSGVQVTSERGLEPGAEILSTIPDVIAQAHAVFGPFFMLIFGAVAVASEFKWGTWAVRFTQGPLRVTVLTAKLAVLALWAVILTMASAIVGIMTACVIALIDGGELVSFSVQDLGQGLLASSLLAVAWALIGAGLGLVLSSLTWAIVAGLVWVLGAEKIIELAVGWFNWPSWLAKILPIEASSGFIGATVKADSGALLPAFLVMAGWAVFVVSAGVTKMLNQDVK